MFVLALSLHPIQIGLCNFLVEHCLFFYLLTQKLKEK